MSSKKRKGVKCGWNTRYKRAEGSTKLERDWVQITQHLVGHHRNFGLYSELGGKPKGGFEPRVHRI